MQNAVAWWASIVLAALPYVLAGVLSGELIARASRRRGVWVAALLLVLPVCDCAGSGYAPALARLRAAPAGFLMMWCAAAAPAALFATFAVLGRHMLAARLAGAAVAAAMTAGGWHFAPASSGSQCRHAGRCAASSDDGQPADVAYTLYCALAGLCWAALCATLSLASGFGRLLTSASPAVAAVAGAVMSPCAASDAFLARVLLHSPQAQAAFVIAAQCVDLRQVVTIWKNFGAARATIAAAGGICGCIAAALSAR